MTIHSARGRIRAAGLVVSKTRSTEQEFRFQRDRVHGNADDNQKRGSAEIEIDTQAVGHPGRQPLEKGAQETRQVIQMDTAIIHSGMNEMIIR